MVRGKINKKNFKGFTSLDRKKKTYLTGLTLLELIVALMILSLVVGVFIPAGYNYTKAKYIGYTKEEMDDIKDALLDFYRDLDQFPKDTGSISNLEDLETTPASTRFYEAGTWRASHWNGPYIQDKFGDNGYLKDAWNTDYKYDYDYTTDPTSCTLTSYGPDRTSGTSDDITIVVDAYSIKREKIDNVQDELDVVKKAANDYTQATGSYPTSIDDIFEWEVLDMHMDEPSWNGTTDEVKDYSGEGNYGTAYNGATTTTGKVGSAGSFDGSNDYVDCGNDTSLDMGTNDHTVEAWIKMEGMNSYGPIVAKRSGSTVDFNYHISDSANDRKMASYNGATSVGGNTALNFDEWYHVAWVYDSGTVYFYLDGQSDGSASQTSGSAHDYNLYVGMDNGGTKFYFDGLIDEVRIYKVALSADEILRHYENPGSPPSYFDLHDYSYKYDEWEDEYKIGSTTVNGQTVYYFYSYGPDRTDDSGSDDDILPRGL
jgi:type II secretory pathway pseudopilin PulG